MDMNTTQVITIISAILTPILVAFIPVFIKRILANVEREKLSYEIAQKKTVDLITEAFPHLLTLEENLKHLAYSDRPISVEDASADPEVTRLSLMTVRLALLQLSVFSKGEQQEYLKNMAHSMLGMQQIVETRHNYSELGEFNEKLREFYQQEFREGLDILFELLGKMVHHA